MSWSTLATSEILEQFTPAEQATLQAIQGADTNLPAIAGRAVRAARGTIAAGGNPLGAADTIPDQVRDDVIAIARWTWLTSFPALKAFQTKDRKDAHDNGRTRLDAIAAGRVRVERPENGDDATVPTQRPMFGTPGVDIPDLKFTDTTQDG